MSENQKNSSQRLKILYLYKILLEKTDEDHFLTMPEIISQLDMHGISAARKALYEDIEALRMYGLDIVQLKGNTSGYYVASRDFELPELKLLADAVSSSRFLTEKKADELLKKIESLASVHEAKQIQRQVYVANRVKSMNERIYLNIDVIQKAIAEGKKISFKYFSYDINKKKKYRDSLRVCSPYAMSWDDQKYYLIGFHEMRKAISNFRVDRMEAVEILDEPITPKPEDFNVNEYMSSSFSMFSGDSQEVKFRMHSSLIGPVIDKFGKDVTLVADGDDHFTVRVKVKPEPPFFGWLFQFGKKAELLEPADLREKCKTMLDDLMSIYNK